jgi:ribokinase
LVEVVGVGALNWDRLLLVDRFAKAGEEIVVKDVREEAGGSAANTIAGLGRLGIECGFIGKIGSDSEGAGIMAAFSADSVDITEIIRAKGRSGSVYAFVDDSGERTMYVNPGVNDTLGLEDFDSNYLGGARFIHVSSFARARAIEAIKAISELLGGSALSFSPGFLSYRGIDFLSPLLENSSILFLNEEEARALTGEGPLKAAEILRELGVGKVAVTLSEKGSIVVGDEGTHEVDGVKASVVDTTGAGDAFSAGFLYGRLRGYNDLNSARIGNFMASRCVQQIGARKGLPDIEVLQTFEKTLP